MGYPTGRYWRRVSKLTLRIPLVNQLIASPRRMPRPHPVIVTGGNAEAPHAIGGMLAHGYFLMQQGKQGAEQDDGKQNKQQRLQRH